MKRALCTIVAISLSISGSAAARVVTPEDVLRIHHATSAKISPDGAWIAYTVSTPRNTEEKAGARYAELRVVSIKTGVSRTFVGGKVNVSGTRWTPDGGAISFLMKRGEEAKTQVWQIPINGGEATQVSNAESNVINFRWHPDGDRIIYTATETKSDRQKALDKKGYGFTYYEEKLRHRHLYYEFVNDDTDDVVQLTSDHTIWTFEVSPDGRRIAMTATERNLIDQRYMFRHIYLLDLESKEITQFSNNPGKLGEMAFSPNGKKIAYTAALTRTDHQVSQVFVQTIGETEARNLTEPDFRGHVHWAGWKNGNTIVYRSSEGVWHTYSEVSASGGKRRVLLDGRKHGHSISTPSHSDGFRHTAFVGSSPEWPSEVFYWPGKGAPKRMTHLNPWIEDLELGRSEVITYNARDGWEVEGLLWYPVGYEPGTRVPLMVAVHGGPESHRSYSWLTSYSRPIEVMTGEGYAVFVPNYRASTGYGLAHTAAHLGDPAGVEFDDIADGIRHLIDVGLADPDRVGLSGGSYGGYAAAWFATYYTNLVKATVMFVGLSDVISRHGTTDIAYEEEIVHSGKSLEEMWTLALERSPIYYAHQSKTATLIIGGDKDTRVHPSQSLELFRRMKMNDHPAVRLVQYPGEGHGNRKMPGRRDVLYRTVQWYNWFVRDANPLDGGMPDVDISELYPIKLPDKKESKTETAIP